ncbi:hypothetical protein [Halosimplex amylolyticum]|uniref:hypothetical protein n=1 Tax=Halosimplex amylolyticum TaxID=3396616 RepID=UPI003F57F810
MDTARRVVLFEGGMGAAWILLGVLNVGVAGLREAWWLCLAALVATVATAYADEHRVVALDEFYRYAVAIVGVVAAVAVCGAVVALTDVAVLTVVGVVLAGIGAGLLGYRVVYGVLRPLPESRLDGAKKRAV